MKFTTILLLLLLFSSCAKTEDTRTGILPPPSPYFPAYPGSYWEYTRGKRIVIEDYLVKLELDEVDGKKSDERHFVQAAKIKHSFFVYRDDLYAVADKIFWRGSSGWYTTDITLRPREKDAEKGTPIPSVTVHGTTYEDVLRFEYDYEGATGYRYEYYAKDVGLIKTFYHSEEWSGSHGTTLEISEDSTELSYYSINSVSE